jgi:hypothetical protein
LPRTPHLRTRKRIAATFAVVAALATGCGGDGDSDEERVADSVRTYFEAVADGNAPRACSALTREARDNASGLTGALRPLPCETALRRIIRGGDHPRTVEVSNVRVAGDRATAHAKARNPEFETDVALTRVGDEWLIAVPPGYVERFSTPPGVPKHEG